MALWATPIPAQGSSPQGSASPATGKLMAPTATPVRRPVPRLRVEDIIEQRRALQVAVADASYPLVPGCEPVEGDLGALPAADRIHHRVSRGLCLPGQWIDRLFADAAADTHATRTLVRMIGSTQWQRGSPRAHDIRIDARIVLAHTQERLSLILRSDDQQDDRLSPRDRVLREGGDGDPGVFRAALRWAAYRTRRAAGMFDLGVRGSTPYVPFIRTRWRYGLQLPAGFVARASQEFYWRGGDDRQGMDSELQFERPLTASISTRFTAGAERNARLIDEGIGWEWVQNLSAYWRIRHRAALQTSYEVRGRTQPAIEVDSRRLNIRLRHSVLRPWLYLDVEPYVIADRSMDFAKRNGVTLRIEVQFGDYR